MANNNVCNRLRSTQRHDQIENDVDCVLSEIS